MRHVTVIQRILPHYRVPFFSRLNTLLNERGIRLMVIYAEEKEGAVPKTVDGEFEWGQKVSAKYRNVFGRTIYSMDLSGVDIPSDLIVLEHALSFLNFYSLYFLRSSRKVALWGHGQNLQKRKKSLIKDHFLKKADWWFGYTEFTRKLLSEKGYDQDRITIVDNTIDTAVFFDEVSRVEEDNRIERELGIKKGRVCIYCGGIYSHKKIDFLLVAAEELARRVPGFSLIVIGSGPEQNKVEKLASENLNIIYLGPLYDHERVPYLKFSSAMLMPGLVGLAVIDCFAAQTPIITTDIPIHSPEIEYLENGVNGLMVEHDVDLYVDAVERYLLDENLQAKLGKGCSESAKSYSIENMAERFRDGVVSWVNA